MDHKNVVFYPGLEMDDRIVIYVTPDAFIADHLGAIYDAEIFTTTSCLVFKVKTGGDFMLATNLNLTEGIKAGKDIWISHLHPTMRYTLDQAKLRFDLVAQN